jgi:hypothetical protein
MDTRSDGDIDIYFNYLERDWTVSLGILHDSICCGSFHREMDGSSNGTFSKCGM